MGVDATIYVRCREGAQTLDVECLPKGFTAMASRQEWWPEGATHEVRNVCRYYGPGYERGHWPWLCEALMSLHAHPDVERVWYGGDAEAEVAECPPARVLELCAHYMRYGDRPYRSGDAATDDARDERKRAAGDPYAHLGAIERLARYLGLRFDPERADWDRAPTPELAPQPDPVIPPLDVEVVCPQCRRMGHYVIPSLGTTVTRCTCPDCGAFAAWWFRREDGRVVAGLPVPPEADR